MNVTGGIQNKKRKTAIKSENKGHQREFLRRANGQNSFWARLRSLICMENSNKIKRIAFVFKTSIRK